MYSIKPKQTFKISSLPKAILTLISFVIVNLCHSQLPDSILNLDYLLVYTPDSTNPNKKYKERFYLYYSDTTTYFASKNYIELKEYVSSAQLKLTNGTSSSLSTAGIPKTGFKLEVYSKRDTRKTILIADFLPTQFALECNPIAWQILSDTQTLKGFKCFKASGKFAGREYLAWFTPEIPITEGPYVFKGLPGLILKIHDSKMHYVWTYEGNCSSCVSKIPEIQYQSLKWISQSDLIKLNSYESKMANLIESGFFDGEWNGISKEEVMKRAEANLKSFNNPIELKE